ncbi:Ig-like domain-containing protein, partial [Chloroflexota bacterium]
WDPAVINVTSVTPATAPPSYTFVPGVIDNDVGECLYGGFAFSNFISGDLTVAYISITVVGSAGETTSLDVTVDELTDAVAGDLISATPVNAHVSIPMDKLLVSIEVTPADLSIARGLTQQFAAWGTYDDGSMANITDLVSWDSTNEARATIQTTGVANPGLVTSLTTGTTTIVATLYEIDGTTTLTVTESKIEIEVEEIVTPPAEAEPSITDVSDSMNENGVTAEDVTAESEDDKVELASDEDVSTVKVPPPKPINWGLIGGIIAGVVVIGMIIWLALKRRIAY